MSERAKKLPIDGITIEIKTKRPKLFIVPKQKAEALIEVLSEFETNDFIPVENVLPIFSDSTKRAAATLRGSRIKEGITQEELSKATKIPQPHLSQMESGVRPIGKIRAKRIAKYFKCDYRIFL